MTVIHGQSSAREPLPIGRAAQITPLAIIALVVCANYADRYVPAILIEPMRAELHLTDTQIGLLTGAGFASGSTVASWLGGSLHGLLGWRSTFVAIGAIGVPLVLLLIHFVREPQRGLADGARGKVVPLPIGESLRRLLAGRSFIYLTLALIFVSIGEYSLIPWMPAFFHRSFGADPTQLGPRLVLYQGAPILVGTLLGGTLADRFSRRMVGGQCGCRWGVWVLRL